MPVRLTTLAAILLFAAPAFAAEPVSAPNPEIDLSALRYYASRNETVRVNAEIRRLRSLYPGWQPPADPAAIPVEAEASPDQSLWDLFAADKLGELKAEIAAKQAADPSFTVPKDLEDKLAAKEARNTLIDASNKGDFSKVVRLASATPGLVSPSDLDIAWRAAEAEARTGDEAAALPSTRPSWRPRRTPRRALPRCRRPWLPSSRTSCASSSPWARSGRMGVPNSNRSRPISCADASAGFSPAARPTISRPPRWSDRGRGASARCRQGRRGDARLAAFAPQGLDTRA